MNMLAAIPQAFPSQAPRRVSTEVRALAAPTCWVTIAPDPVIGVHNFTPALLQEFGALIHDFREARALHAAGLGPVPPAYAVVQSSHPAFFNQGGDLAFFRDCIARGDFDGLHRYSLQCWDALHAWNCGMKESVSTVSLVQGRALGGGFELALSADWVIAEEQSSFGFPEVMFGLFPCTGAMGLLCQRTSVRMAERIMTNKRVYTAAELFEMGIVDQVCPTGFGELAVERHIAEHARRRKARLKVQASRERECPLDYDRGVRIVEDWVETARQLSAEELRSMEMLIMMQQNEAREAAARAA
ncbi:MAG: crotonase/enoyl-CoA hydratase family protein [Pseudoxanthomonas sp.]